MPLKSREALPIRTVSTLTATSAVDIHSSDYRFTPRRRAATYTLPKKRLISIYSTSLIVGSKQRMPDRTSTHRDERKVKVRTSTLRDEMRGQKSKLLGRRGHATQANEYSLVQKDDLVAYCGYHVLWSIRWQCMNSTVETTKVPRSFSSSSFFSLT